MAFVFTWLCCVCAIYIPAFNRKSDLSEISKVIDYSISSVLNLSLSFTPFDLIAFIITKTLSLRNYVEAVLLLGGENFYMSIQAIQDNCRYYFVCGNHQLLSQWVVYKSER